MNFCYLHPDTEAQGQCTGCGNWICSKDYNLLDEQIGSREEWVRVRNYNSSTFNSSYNDELVTRPIYGPVIFCTVCFEKNVGIKSELTESEGYLHPEKLCSKKKVLMCTQCGEKLQETDKFCPSCGDSTQDEFYDSEHSLDGLQSSKKLR